MPGKRIEIAAQFLHIHRHVRDGLSAVEQLSSAKSAKAELAYESTANGPWTSFTVHGIPGARGFEARSQVTTWILGIARYKALSALRQRSFASLDDEVAEAFEDPADDPEVAMQKTDRGAVLQACLQQLSSAHRQVIDLVYYHEQSIEEIARIIGVPQNTVKTRVFHARKRIAELMAAQGVERAYL